MDNAKHYVWPNGEYLGQYMDGATPPDGAIEVSQPPDGRAMWSAARGWTVPFRPVVPAVDNPTLMFVGDSMTRGQGPDDAPTHSYPMACLSYLNATFGIRPRSFVLANSGRTSGEIAFVMGAAANQTITLVGGAIPASGPVNVATIMGGVAGASRADPLGGDGIRSRDVVLIDGAVEVKGVLARSQAQVNGSAVVTYTFTRQLDGDIIQMANPECRFDDVERVLASNPIGILCIGRNNLSQPNPIREDMMRIAARFTGGKVLALAVPTFPNNLDGSLDTADRTRAEGVATDLRHIFGDGGRFLNFPEFMYTRAIGQLGVTKTAGDDVDIAARMIPRSLRLEASNGHLNAQGDGLLGRLVADRLLANGWLRAAGV